MSEKFLKKSLAHSTTLSANGEQSRIHWQKLFESVMAKADGRVVFAFFQKLFTNAERMNNISKSLSIFLLLRLSGPKQ